MKPIYTLMIAVMLTACGSATITIPNTPEIPLDYLTDGIVNTKDLPDAPTRPKDVVGDGFLIVDADGFNATDIHEGHKLGTVRDYRRGGRDSESPDGFAQFFTSIQETDEGGDIRVLSSNAYNGILSTTNLGAPLVDPPTDAIWPGYFNFGSLGYRSSNFYVNFTSGHFGFYNGMSGEASGISTRDDTWGGLLGGGGVVISRLDGYFGNHPNAVGLNPGQMVGTFTSDWTGVPIFNDYYEADLIGLIGEEGAVGVFGTNGGFTATNLSYTPLDPCDDKVEGICVEYADWADRFLTSQPNTPNQFLSGDEILLIDTKQKGNLNLKDTILKDATSVKMLKPVVLAGNGNSGVAYFKGGTYAGLLSGTNLGEPLTEESGKAEWVGRYSATSLDPRMMTLEIDFASKKVEAFVRHASQGYYHLIGDYNKNGVITGTVDVGFFDAGTRTPTAESTRYPGVLTGLIGQNGAVGAFVSIKGDTTNSFYAGGFVAHPYGN